MSHSDVNLTCPRIVTTRHSDDHEQPAKLFDSISLVNLVYEKIMNDLIPQESLHNIYRFSRFSFLLSFMAFLYN